MDIFIVIIVFITIYKISFVKPITSIDRNVLSKERCLPYRGLLAIIIFFCHLFLRIPAQDNCQLAKVNYVGYLAVSLFFFISGYGLMRQYSIREDYLNNLIIKRIPKMLITLLFFTLIYIFTHYFVSGLIYEPSYIIQSFYNGSPVVENAWYLETIIVFYFAFFVLCKTFKKNYKYIILFILLFIIILDCILIYFNFFYLDENKWCYFGVHWYISTFPFAVGMIWYLLEDYIYTFLSSNINWILSFIVLVFLFIPTFFFNKFFSLSSIQVIVVQNIASITFTLIFILLCLKIIIFSPILSYIGIYGLEFYLIHTAIMDILKPLSNNVITYTFATFLISLLSAILINKVINKIFMITVNRIQI